MESLKTVFSKPAVKYGFFAILIIAAAWIGYTIFKRNTDRKNLIGYLTGLAENDPWKAQIIAKAQATGLTVDQQIIQDAYYMIPANIFSPRK